MTYARGVQNKDNTNKDNIFYFYNITNTPGKSVTPYPNPNDTESWKGLVLEWLNGGSGSNPRSGEPLWCFIPHDRSGDEMAKLVPNPNFLGDVNKYWFAKTNKIAGGGAEYNDGQPDNFMSRFGIVPQSPIFTYWFNNKNADKTMRVDASAFGRLLGDATANAGGWLGYLQGQENKNYDDYDEQIHTTVAVAPIAPPPPCKTPSPADVILPTAAALGGSLTMLAFPGIGWFGFAGIIVAAVASAASAGYSASKSTC